MASYSGVIGAAPNTLYRDLGDDEIRLLHLHPSRSFNAPIYTVLHTAKFSGQPVYRALSYVWGDPNITSTISVNGDDFEVTTNLASALRHLRGERAVKVLWVDAVCINQPDVDERSHQVQIMAKIYKSAQEVIAWLGECENKSDKAMRLLRRWGSVLAESGFDGYSDCRKYVASIQSTASAEAFFATIEDPFSERDWSALCDIYKRAYWRRLWIFQEFVLARKVTLMCGFDRVPAHHLLTEVFFIDIVRFFPMSDPTTSLRRTLGCVYKERNLVRDLLKWQDYMHRYGGVPGAKLFKLLYDMSFRKCTDPRDYLFGASGFCTAENPQITVNYSLDPRDVSVAFACSRATQSDLEILSYAGIGYKKQSPIVLSFPSWVPDWSDAGRSRGSSYHPHLFSYADYSAGGHQPGACKVPDAGSHSTSIEISGAVLSTVVDLLEGGTGWEEPSDPRWRTLFKNECGTTYLDGIPMLQAYLRILLADLERTSPAFQLDEPGSPGEFAVNFLEQYCLIGQGSYSNEERDGFLARTTTDGTIHSFEVEHLFRKGEEPTLDLWNQCIQNAHKLERNFLAARRRGSRRRGFFTTSNGYMGTGPPYARQRDVVCIIQGANVPFLLRPHEDGFLLVGEAFVLGLMDGEYKGEFEAIKIH